jgi:hypothetical protein
MFKVCGENLTGKARRQAHETNSNDNGSICELRPQWKREQLSEDESKIVAVGSTYSEAVEQSEKAGESDPVMIKTPSAWAPFSV